MIFGFIINILITIILKRRRVMEMMGNKLMRQKEK